MSDVLEAIQAELHALKASSTSVELSLKQIGETLSKLNAMSTHNSERIAVIEERTGRHEEEIFGSSARGTEGLKVRADTVDRLIGRLKGAFAGVVALLTINGGLALVQIWVL